MASNLKKKIKTFFVFNLLQTILKTKNRMQVLPKKYLIKFKYSNYLVLNSKMIRIEFSN